MDKSDWDLDDGYFSKRPETYPRRVQGSGKHSGLLFLITQKQVPGVLEGFQISLHLPCEAADLSRQLFLLPFNKIATLQLTPELRVTESLRNYDSEVRQCYFQEEKKLKFFKLYTKSNCNYECSINHIREFCKCVPDHLPRLKNETSCSETDHNSDCALDALRDLTTLKMEKSLKTSKTYDDKGKDYCGCLSSCNSLQYDGSTSYADIENLFKPEPNMT